jgi:RNA polymerase sigma factor (sigma-70 family)
MSEPTVYVVDDDASIRELLTWLMKREGIRVAAFASAQEFLASWRDEGPGCLVLDLHMPGMSGLDLQKYLIDHGVPIPVVFLSGQADVTNAVHAVKSGAVDFIEKPFDYRRIVEVLRDCLRRDSEERPRRAKGREVARRLASLSQREREVLDRVVAGRTNREIAEALDISVKTVEAHRAHLMEKLEVGSVAELVQATLSAAG